MLETYFKSARTLARLRSGPSGLFVDGFADSLRGAGYSRWTGRKYLRAAAHVGEWVRLGGASFTAFDDAALDEFVSHLSTCSCFWPSRGEQQSAVFGARWFLAYLRARGVVPETTTVVAAIPEVLQRFEGWMRGHRGVVESTLEGYRLVLVELLEQGPPPDLFTAASLRGFLSGCADRHGRSRARTGVKALRMFLRYLVTEGLCEPALVDAIPTIAEWRLSSLPRYLSPEDVERIASAPDVATPHGRRDRAILLLLARLGLRAGDVVALRLADIDWKAGTLLLSGKARWVSRLPLPQDAGDAIRAYLEDGRPKVDDAHVFLRARPPNGKLRTSSAVSYIVESAAKRAKVEMPRGRAHALRHSLATALVRSGVSLHAVGAVLRHRSLDTTAIYAKVDVAALRQVAQPWPLETSPC